MKKESKKFFLLGTSVLAAFLLWTVLVRFVNVKSIGPQGSVVGLSTLNRFFYDFIGTNMTLYAVTDWLGLVPIFLAMGFAFLGLSQWIKRKKLLMVDYSILVLGGFYLVTIGAYLFFEDFVINYRPVLINGYLEASYPSSTTMLALCVMPTAIMQLYDRIKNPPLRKSIAFILTAFTAFMVIGRLISGVHWISDIIGGMLLSTGLVTMYYAIVRLK